MVTFEEGGGAMAAAIPATSSNSSPNNTNNVISSNPNSNNRSNSRGGVGGGKKPKSNKEVVPVIQLPEETTNLYKKLGQVLPFENITVTIYIPTVCVGAVIGKKGATIAKIQKWAQQLAGIHSDQVRISVVHHPQSLAGSGYGSGGDYHQQQQPQHHFVPTSPRGMMSPEEPVTSNSKHHQSTSSSAGSPLLIASNPAASTSSIGLGSPGTPTVIPFTYTELDFSDANWTPVVIRAPTLAGMVVSATIMEICLEYVLDRTQIQYIFDLPISSQNQQTSAASSSGSSSAINNAHATIIGKRGQTIMTLSANSNCRIMVPPKHLKHDVIQLEGPLRECTRCLEAIANLLSSSQGESPTTPSKSNGSNNNIGSTSGTAVATPSSSNSKSIAKNAQIRSNDNKYQCSFVVRPLPSQTKLRNIARRTETVIRKTRRNKADFDDAASSLAETGITTKTTTAAAGSGDMPSGEVVAGIDDTVDGATTTTGDSPSGAANAGDVAEGVSGGIPWQLTILGSSPGQVRAAWKRLEMFKIADLPKDTNITLNGTGDDGMEGDCDDLSATGGGDTEEGTDQHSDSETGEAVSSPPAKTRSPGKTKRGCRGARGKRNINNV